MNHIYLLFVLICILSCNTDKVEYDNSDKLENYIKANANYNLKDKSNNFVVVILQNEDCICTDDDVELANEIIYSKRFSSYKKVLIVNSLSHKIFKKISKEKMEGVKIIHDQSGDMMKEGYIATTDRIIVYRNGIPIHFLDLHLTKPNLAKKELFN